MLKKTGIWKLFNIFIFPSHFHVTITAGIITSYLMTNNSYTYNTISFMVEMFNDGMKEIMKKS